MKPRHKRMAFIGAALAAVAVAATLVLQAAKDGIMLFVSPTEVADNKAPVDRSFRLGGLVQEGSVSREGIIVNFVITDNNANIPVSYSGILPDLFREGQGVVTQGRLDSDGVFQADEVLAKHDETYMPPEVAEALEKAKQAKGETLAVEQGGI